MDISRKFLSDPVIRWLLKEGRGDIYIVGGYIRDLLTGRISRDRDFAYSGDAAGLAKKAAKKFNGTFILLKDGLTCRVVLKDSSVIDINFLKEPIEEDLLRRDFRMNALAWSPESGLLDPTGGTGDINKRSIRQVSDSNLKGDSLRLLRAYRLSAELGFKIENKTRVLIKNNSKLIINSAKERVTEEFIKILNKDNAGKYLRLCSDDGLLNRIINIDPYRLSENLNIISRFDNWNKSLNVERYIKGAAISQGLTISGLIRLTALFVGYKGIQHINTMLKLSRVNTIALAKTLSAIFRAQSCRVTERSLYGIFSDAEERSIETALLISIIKRRDKDILLKAAERFLHLRSHPIITGDDIQEILGVGPGREIGRILDKLNEVRFHENITTKAEAKRWLMSNLT